jgi:hypothetical protein
VVQSRDGATSGRDRHSREHGQQSKSEWVEGMVRRLETLLILMLMLACSVLLTML